MPAQSAGAGSVPTGSAPPLVALAVRRLLAGLDDLCTEIFDLAISVSPEIEAQPADVLADMRRWQRWLVGVGLSAVLSDRPFEDLGEAISGTARRRGVQGVSLSATLTAGDAALRLVAERVLRELGPGRSGTDLAFVNGRVLEFLRVLSVYSAAAQGGRAEQEQPAADRPALCAQLLLTLLAEEATSPGEDGQGADPVSLAARAGIRLPLRYVIALPGDTASAALDRRHAQAVVTTWKDCVVVACADPVELSGPAARGTAEVTNPRGGLAIALEAARRALAVAVATGRPELAAAEATLIGAALAVPDDDAQAAVQSCFGGLAQTPRGAELLDTLSALLTWGRVAVTARALHLHRHTLEYRIRRIEELTGMDLSDPVVRLRCQLALLVLRRWPHRPGPANGSANGSEDGVAGLGVEQ